MVLPPPPPPPAAGAAGAHSLLVASQVRTSPFVGTVASTLPKSPSDSVDKSTVPPLAGTNLLPSHSKN